MTTEGEIDGPSPLASGRTLVPGYTVLNHLRRGEDLDVYDLWSAERGCRCIGKTVRPDRLTARGARARLLREGRLLLRLSHPHIVRAYEIVSSSNPIVVLATLPGETLTHLIDRQRTRMRAVDVAQLGMHLCSAIGYLHRHGILHLDLKPSNIVATHGLATVLDLSLARAPGRYRGGSGTPGYMAPEQITGGELGPPADVWGIGATLFEAASGGQPCDAGDDSATISSELSRDPCRPEPVGRLRRLPKPLTEAIDRCLSLNPADRQTVAELSASLECLVENQTEPRL